MSDDAKKPDIKLVETPAPESVFDDIEALRKTATLKVSRRVVAINVAVRKPPNNVYFRCHPDTKMSLDASLIVDPDDRDDFYFVTPFMLNHHAILPRLRKVTIAVVYTWPGGAVSLWPVPMAEGNQIKCWKSARAAYELAKQQWVQLC
jgi:hypothetical protein